MERGPSGGACKRWVHRVSPWLCARGGPRAFGCRGVIRRPFPAPRPRRRRRPVRQRRPRGKRARRAAAPSLRRAGHRRGRRARGARSGRLRRARVDRLRSHRRARARGGARPNRSRFGRGVLVLPTLRARNRWAPPIRFERTTNALGKRCSIQLSYGGNLNTITISASCADCLHRTVLEINLPRGVSRHRANFDAVRVTAE